MATRAAFGGQGLGVSSATSFTDSQATALQPSTVVGEAVSFAKNTAFLGSIGVAKTIGAYVDPGQTAVAIEVNTAPGATSNRFQVSNNGAMQAFSISSTALETVVTGSPWNPATTGPLTLATASLNFRVLTVTNTITDAAVNTVTVTGPGLAAIVGVPAAIVWAVAADGSVSYPMVGGCRIIAGGVSITMSAAPTVVVPIGAYVYVKII